MKRAYILSARTAGSVAARRKSAFLRIHFWAALIASPFAIVAALTGILFIFTPQIERALYASLDRVQPAQEMRPLDDAIAAAYSAAPSGWTLRSVVPAHGTHESIKMHFSAPKPHAHGASHEGHGDGHGATATAAAAKPAFDASSQGTVVVYVNPYTAEVLGALAENDRFGAWAKKLHSSLLQGDNWRWMIEMAASWLVVMLLTGAYLWWPRGKQKALPQAGAAGGTAWRQWHGFIGVALSVVSLAILVTGLTWSKYSGEQVRAFRDTIGQAPPPIPQHIKSTVIEGAAPLTWQAALDAVRRHAPDMRVQIAGSRAEHGVWRVHSLEPGKPAGQFKLMLDRYTGQKLYHSGWDQQTAFSKATAIGISLHRGEFGAWNQALLLVFGIGIVFSLVSGWMMIFKRRKSGANVVPRLLPGAWRSMPAAAWIAAAALCILMPLFALTGAVVMACEMFMQRRTYRAAVYVPSGL